MPKGFQEMIRTEMILSARRALHDLCQPVTAMACLLDLARRQDDPEELKNAVDAAMVQCDRVFNSVEKVRNALQGPVQELEAGLS